MAKKKSQVRYESNLVKVEANYDKALKNNIDIAVSIFHNKWLQLMHTQKSGKSYKVGGKVHIASAPGETPAVWFGILKGKFKPVIKVKANQVVANLGVSSEVDYARRLEFGSPKGQMAPRPLWRPTTESVKGEILKLFKPVKGSKG